MLFSFPPLYSVFSGPKHSLQQIRTRGLKIYYSLNYKGQTDLSIPNILCNTFSKMFDVSLYDLTIKDEWEGEFWNILHQSDFYSARIKL